VGAAEPGPLGAVSAAAPTRPAGQIARPWAVRVAIFAFAGWPARSGGTECAAPRQAEVPEGAAGGSGLEVDRGAGWVDRLGLQGGRLRGRH
jgi:hypothetical protein